MYRRAAAMQLHERAAVFNCEDRDASLRAGCCMCRDRSLRYHKGLCNDNALSVSGCNKDAAVTIHVTALLLAGPCAKRSCRLDPRTVRLFSLSDAMRCLTIIIEVGSLACTQRHFLAMYA